MVKTFMSPGKGKGKFMVTRPCRAYLERHAHRVENVGGEIVFFICLRFLYIID